MKPTAFLRAASLLALALLQPGCEEPGECNQLFGSAGESVSLSFSGVRVQWLSDSEALSVFYEAPGGVLPAVFTADLRGLAPRSGLDVDLSERVGSEDALVPRGSVRRVANDGHGYGRLEGGTLRLATWEGGGGEAEGDISALLDDGRSLNGEFCATIDAPVLD